MEKTIFIVEGMSCMHCANAVKDAVKELYSMATTTVDLASKEVVVCSELQVDAQQIKTAIEQEGYTVLDIR